MFKKILLFLIILFCLIEFSSRFFLIDYFTQSNNFLFYTKNNDVKTIERKGLRDRSPHPYWGYISNRFGETYSIFNDQSSTKKEVKFAVLGGSVAASICNYVMDDSNDIAKQILRTKFKNFNKITIICYAEGGYKQPQPLHIINTIQPEVDFTLNIEGSNELNYELEPYTPHYFPLRSFTYAFFSSLGESTNHFVSMNTLSSIKTIKKKLVENEYAMKTFELIDQVKILYYRKKLHALIKNIQLIQKEKSIRLKGVELETRMNFWLNMSCQQSNSLANRGINSYYFLQPLPYILGSKTLTKQEQSLVNTFVKQQSNDRKIRNIQDKYNKIEAMDWIEIGLKMHSLTGVFKGNNEDIYEDGCCHFMENGQKIVLEKILSVVDPYKNKPHLCSFMNK